MLLNRIHGNGRVARFSAEPPKGVAIIAIGVGFGSDEFAIRVTTPKVCPTGMEKGAGERAKGSDELAGVAALKSGSGKLQKKLLEGFVRLRRAAGNRVSNGGSQWPPIAWLRD
jgi:hypothetical protein